MNPFQLDMTLLLCFLLSTGISFYRFVKNSITGYRPHDLENDFVGGQHVQNFPIWTFQVLTKHDQTCQNRGLERRRKEKCWLTQDMRLVADCYASLHLLVLLELGVFNRNDFSSKVQNGFTSTLSEWIIAEHPLINIHRLSLNLLQ